MDASMTIAKSGGDQLVRQDTLNPLAGLPTRLKLLIAIPALNEEQSIRGIIERSLAARRYILENSPVTEVAITVVSDGSTDATVERAREYAQDIEIIVFEKNRGYGAAIMEAWSRSDAELLSFLDADGTCEPRFFADLCRNLVEQEADVILGCRLNESSQMPKVRRLGNTIFATLLAGLSNKTVRDTASGMRVVRRSALRNLYPLPTGLHFTPAMSARAMLSDCVRITEIDMPYAEREGRSKLSVLKDGLRFLNVIVSTALLYRPEKFLNTLSLLAVLAGAALMVSPALLYAREARVEEWMIYRFLVFGLCMQVAGLLWGAGAIAGRAVEVAIEEEIRPARRWVLESLRSAWFWPAVGAGLVGCGWLVAPAAWQFAATGHTDAHWSRFVIALTGGQMISLGLVFKGLDALLELVEGRVRYLAGRHG
jgi:glycosyltransferase involved in cell wall biosynthesis